MQLDGSYTQVVAGFVVGISILVAVIVASVLL